MIKIADVKRLVVKLSRFNTALFYQMKQDELHFIRLIILIIFIMFYSRLRISIRKFADIFQTHCASDFLLTFSSFSIAKYFLLSVADITHE